MYYEFCQRTIKMKTKYVLWISFKRKQTHFFTSVYESSFYGKLNIKTFILPLSNFLSFYFFLEFSSFMFMNYF